MEWLDEFDNNEGVKNGGEWAALADTLFHEEEGAPCAICPFVVGGPCLFLEEGGDGGIAGKESVMTLKKAFWETQLNWFVRSKKTATREGRIPVDWGREIYFFTCSRIVLMMRFVQFGVPTT